MTTQQRFAVCNSCVVKWSIHDLPADPISINEMRCNRCGGLVVSYASVTDDIRTAVDEKWDALQPITTDTTGTDPAIAEWAQARGVTLSACPGAPEPVDDSEDW